MDHSEDLDLDSLMGLLDDNDPFNESTANEPIASSVTENKDLTSMSHVGDRSKELKDMFGQDLLTPMRVENPKEEEKCVQPAFIPKSSVVHSGETDSSDEENKEYLTESGQNIKREMKKNLSHSSPRMAKPSSSTWSSKAKSASNTDADNSFVVDSYSGIRIINPLVSFSALQQRMQGRKMIKMSFIQNFVKNGDIEGDWVTMGVIVQKVPPKKSANGNTYSIWKMSDLHDAEKAISVFLFKAAQKELWKTTVGTVIGILNPSVMPDRDKRGELNLAVDHPGKCMIMGKSKDLGFCKSKRKDGTPCNVPVNIFQCEYCVFHIKSEYKKFSSKRSELQSAFSGRDFGLKNKVLKGQNVFYGGQSFTALGNIFYASQIQDMSLINNFGDAYKKFEHSCKACSKTMSRKPSGQIKSKDKLTLSNLGLKRKAAEALENVEKEKAVKKLSDIYGPDIMKAAENNSEFINNKLTVPSVGSRNLLRHLMEKSTGDTVKVISPKDQLKLFESRKNAVGSSKQQLKDHVTLKNLMPQLGRGLSPGQEVNLDFSSSKPNNARDYAKLRAIQKIRENGPLKSKDPNSTKTSVESSDKVKAVLDRCLEEKKVIDPAKIETSPVVTSKLGSLDMSSERVKEILNRKSSHAYEIEMAEMEKEVAYFNALEKKERMEEKMASTKEIVCDVVSCKKCKYTAHSASERCLKEQHPLKCHKALKRFFACKDCKHRTFAFTKFPTQVCRVCRGSSFERTSMMKPRKGPKLDSETLNICGDEAKFLDSQQTMSF